MTTSANYNDILAAYVDYPSPVRPVLAYAATLAQVRSIFSETLRVAFIDLVSRANMADPQQPIMVRVDVTAAKLGISEKSVSRTIKLMLANAWMEASKSHDGRNNRGRYAWKEYIFTPALRTLLKMPEDQPKRDEVLLPSPKDTVKDNVDGVCKADDTGTVSQDKRHLKTPPSVPQATTKDSVGYNTVHKALDIVARLEAKLTSSPVDLVVAKSAGEILRPPQDNPDQSVKNLAVEPKLSSGLIYAVNKVFNKKEASFKKAAFQIEAFLENPENPKPKSESKINGKPARVPASLREMCDALDILPEGICSLMRLAKERGHWLQDIWTVKKDLLMKSGIKNGRAVEYIRYLLTCGDDFSYVARTKVPVPQKPQASHTQAPVQATPEPQPQPGLHAEAATSCDKVQPSVRDANIDTAGTSPDVPKAQMMVIAKACRFKLFRHVSNGARVRMFDGTAEVVIGAKNTILGGWDQMQQLYRDIAGGSLVEVAQ